MKVSEIMTADPLTISPGDSVRSAMGRLYDKDIRHLPVVDARGGLVGIFTDRDLKEHLGDAMGNDRDEDERKEALADPIESVMTEDPVTVRGDTAVTELIDLLMDEKFGAVPVVDDGGALVGIVTYIDVLRAARGVL